MGTAPSGYHLSQFAPPRPLPTGAVNLAPRLATSRDSSPLDPSMYGRIELARTGHVPESRGAVLAAVAALAEEVEAAWNAAPPALVVIWERRRALGSLVAHHAVRAGVPVVVVQNGFAAGTVLVDRLVDEETTLLRVRPLLPPGGEAAAPIVWRRPARFGAVPDSQRFKASAGLWLDYGEKLLRAALGFPSLLPLTYWRAFAADRLRSSAATATLPADARFALLALHTPAVNGRGADPIEFTASVVDALPPDRTLVICPHPGDRQAGQLAVLAGIAARRPRTFLLARSPAWVLLGATDLLITLSSAIGFEALCRGTPTLALPSAYYAREGLAVPVTDRLIIGAVATEPSAFRPDPALVERMRRTLLAEHVIPAAPDRIPDRAAQVALTIRRLAAWDLPPHGGQRDE